ncbi:MAG: hypothetical protein PHX18_06095 [Candidatus Gastranaerophilales bacterium]|nr:hypothetical protein [Candidatus Gastranaerophilales bacterium]
MAIVSSIFSTLGNNSSLVPIIVKDSVETVGRVSMAYNEGAKTSKRMGALDAREKLIEANTTSIVWLGGIPLLKVLFDKLITNNLYGFNKIKEYGLDAFARTDIRLLNQKSPQALRLENITDEALKGHVKKIVENPQGFKKLFATRSAVTTLLPALFLGWVLPKMIYKYTNSVIEKQKKQELKHAFERQMANQHQIVDKNPAFASFMGKAKNNNLSFGGIADTISTWFTCPVKNMVMVDAGLVSGRIATTRRPMETAERAIFELGYVLFLYCGGKYVAKGLEAIGKKFFKTPISLDSKIIEDKNFQSMIMEATKNNKAAGKLAAIKNIDEAGLIKLIDGELAKNGGKLKDLTLQAAEKLGLISIVKGKRNPLKYIEPEKVKELGQHIEDLITSAAGSKNAEKFISKVKNLRRASVIANVAACSFALAYILPQIQFWFRRTFNKTSVAPGLSLYYEEEQKAKAQSKCVA